MQHFSYSYIKTNQEIWAPEGSIQCATLDDDATKMQEPPLALQHLACRWHQTESLNYNLNVPEMPLDDLLCTWWSAERRQEPADSSQLVEA